MGKPNYCDIIMRGGITSGVVYPGAVVELAERGYTFKNVGGASAGAIAAAMTAAAQCAENTGSKTADPKAKFRPGFAGIAELPGWFGGTTGGASGPSNMLRLFQPQKETGRLFTILMWVLRSGREKRGDDGRAKYEKATKLWTMLRIALGLAAAFPPIAALVLAFGTAVVVAACYGGSEASVALLKWLSSDIAERWNCVRYLAGALAGIGALVATLITAAAALGIVAYRYTNRRLPKNFFGICSGGDDKRDPHYTTEDPPPLGRWMAETINELSGKYARDPKPLTFGDLWGPGKSVRDANLRLQVMTTDLSRSRPYRMPFDDDDSPFYFAETEFRRLFPKEVVDWMVKRSEERLAANVASPEPPELRKDLKHRGHLVLLPLPLARDLPVVVATRMSMSFPLLLGAVPLYTAPEQGTDALRHWFSDGGMCSNFPIHMFDSPLPRWPTFGINLRYFDENRSSTHGALAPPLREKRSYLPTSDQDQKFSFNFPIDESGITSFVTAIKSAMQNWLDFAQMDYPGFRDRIAQVYLDSKEGGMNLNMPEGAIRKLSDRGKAAAGKLANQFAPGNTTPYAYSWPNHQRVRFQTFMRLSEEAFRTYSRNYTSEHYDVLLKGDQAAATWSAEYLSLADKFEKAAPSPGSIFDNENAPSPYAIFRIMPDV